MIRGHIGPGYEVPMGEASLFAFIDSVEYGSHFRVTTGHIQRYTFPIPLGDLKSPRISPVMLAQDEFDPADPFVSEPAAHDGNGARTGDGLGLRGRTGSPRPLSAQGSTELPFRCNPALNLPRRRAIQKLIHASMRE